MPPPVAKGKLVGISSRGGLHDVTMHGMLAKSGVNPSQANLLRSTRRAEGIAREIDAKEVFDFSYLEAVR